VEKTLEQKMEQDFIPRIQKMIENEKTHQENMCQEIERLQSSRYGKFMNFIFPLYNESIDEMVLVVHSFVKESERLQAHMESRVKEYKKFFLKQD